MLIPGIKFIQGKWAYTDTDGHKYGIGVHNTSNDGSALDEAHWAQHRPDGTSSHLYADGLEVIQSLDTVDRAGHSGTQIGNDNAVAIEIVGVNEWSREHWIANVNWRAVGLALAYVVQFYGIAVRRASVAEMKANPKVKAFYSHNDMRLAWPGKTDHNDPGPNFPWDVLFNNVNMGLMQLSGHPESEEDMRAASLGPIVLGPNTSSLNIPPVEAGLADPAHTWLNMCNDTFDTRTAYRIYLSKGDKSFFPLPGYEKTKGCLALDSGERLSVQLPAGVSCVSITRYALDTAGNIVAPDANNHVYAGHLTCTFERQATA